MSQAYELPQFGIPEVIGSGYSGYTYRVEIDGVAYACTVVPELPGNEDTIWSFTHDLANTLGVPISDLLEQGFLLPIDSIELDEQTDVLIKQAISNHSGFKPEPTIAKIRSMESTFGINPLIHQGEFANLLVRSPRFLDMFAGNRNDTKEMIQAIKEYAKFGFPHNLHLYPLIEDSPESIREIFVKFRNHTGIVSELLSIQNSEHLLLWLAEKADMIAQAGYVNGDYSLGNILSSNIGYILADHKDCKRITRELSVKDRKRFIWIVKILLAPGEILNEVQKVIVECEPFSRDNTPVQQRMQIMEKMLPAWIQQFFHGVYLPTVIPQSKPVEGNEQIVRRVLRRLGYSDDLLKVIDNFPYSNLSYTQFVQQIFGGLHTTNTQQAEYHGKKRRRRR